MTNTITLGNVVSWTITIGVGIVIVSLVKYIWGGLEKKVDKIDSWKDNRPSPTEILLKADHIIFCDGRMKGIIDYIEKQTKTLKEHFDEKHDTLMVEIKKINNRK